MNYVEWLRIRNCLRVVAIILAIFVLLAVVLRVSVARYMSPDAWIEHFHDPGTTVSHVVLPDGTKRTILDNAAEQTHVVIDDRGQQGKHIVVTEPTARAHTDTKHVNVGSIQVQESRHGSLTTTTIDTNGSVPMLYYMAFADLFAIVIGTFLAAPLAREIDGHLEVSLTKPVSRARFAVGAIGIDVLGILGTSLLTVVALYICQLLFETPSLDFSGINARAIAMGIASPLAWYALLCALTTWLNRSWIGVLAAALPIAGVVGILTLLPTQNVIALFIHDTAWVISRLNPLSYVSMAVPSDDGTVSYRPDNFGLRFTLEVMFFVVYGAIAVWRWQRVEA